VISVVIPTHNRAHLVRRAVASALAQTFADLEVIVVDDGSTDGTGALLASLTDPRVRALRLPRRTGAARARNAGVAAARGEWIAFLDSDDEWTADKLARQAALAGGDGAPSVVTCICAVRRGDDVRHTPAPDDLVADDMFTHLLRWNRRPPTTSAYLVARRALLEVGGFDERLPSAQDIDLWLRLAQARHAFAAVAAPLVVKHEHDGPQISRDAVAVLRGFLAMERRWGAPMRARLGAERYEAWKARRLRAVRELGRARLARIAARRDVVDAARCAAWMLALVPRLLWTSAAAWLKSKCDSRK
jgi:glycosyltransferase involved in cell wall biosynthesis